MDFEHIVEKNTESSRNNYRLQKSMLYYMEKIEFFFHKELYSDEEAEEVGSKASMLSLASNLLFLGYGIDLKLHHMIDSQTDVALSRATMAIRNECHRFLKSREFLDYLKENNIPGICGIDTRCLTKTVREYGVMNAKLTYTKPEKSDAEALKGFKITGAVKAVMTDKTEVFEAENAKYNVVMMDFGAKYNIRRQRRAALPRGVFLCSI